MYKKVLVAYDNSDAAKRALEDAVELAEKGVAKKILVMSVYEPDSSDPTFEVAARLSGNMNEEDVVDETPLDVLRASLADQIAAHPDFIDTFVTRGKPGEVIVEAAKDNGCDLIVMGRRGLGGISAMLGSVSKTVLQNSSLPVLITR